jgi:hypothetical protein
VTGPGRSLYLLVFFTVHYIKIISDYDWMRMYLQINIGLDPLLSLMPLQVLVSTQVQGSLFDSVVSARAVRNATIWDG